jgi:hypothetical protein
MVTRLLSLFACLLFLLVSSGRASTYVVTNTYSSGAGSFRAAVDSVNTHAGADSIHFNIPGPVGQIEADIPYVLNGDDTVLDGYTQPGTAVNTAKVGNFFNAIIAIEFALDLVPPYQDTALTINGARNVVRGVYFRRFKNGIVINGDNTVIEGCSFHELGIVVGPSSGVRIGGTTPASRNLIRNAGYGISIGGESGHHVSNLTIQGNDIGPISTDGGCTIGIYIYGYTTGVMIGGHQTTPCTLNGAMNIINASWQQGIALEGEEVSGISMLSNMIYSNHSLGIDINRDGVTPNDPGDSDNGPNHRQNFPRILSAQGNSIYGMLESAANRAFTIQVFDNFSSACDPSGHGEGKLIYGETAVVTDQFGDASFTVSCGAAVAGHYYTATATDDEGNTSEFSACFELSQATATSNAPAHFALLANMPNPFNPATVIPFEMGAAGHVDIVVFDIAGRRVRTLVSQYHEAGPGSARWDGRDDHGKPVASGVYFCRMSAKNFSASRKVVLLN